jgi:hypothetical protein
MGKDFLGSSDAEVADKFLDYNIESGPESVTCGLGTQMVMKRASYASLLRFANISGVQMPEAFAGCRGSFSGAHITFGHVTLGNQWQKFINPSVV